MFSDFALNNNIYPYCAKVSVTGTEGANNIVSSGSGVVFRENNKGILLTAAHVICNVTQKCKVEKVSINVFPDIEFSLYFTAEDDLLNNNCRIHIHEQYTESNSYDIAIVEFMLEENFNIKECPKCITKRAWKTPDDDIGIWGYPERNEGISGPIELKNPKIMRSPNTTDIIIRYSPDSFEVSVSDMLSGYSGSGVFVNNNGEVVLLAIVTGQLGNSGDERYQERSVSVPVINDFLKTKNILINFEDIDPVDAFINPAMPKTSTNFIRKYYSPLFLDRDIQLQNVYFEPNVEEVFAGKDISIFMEKGRVDVKKASSVVDAFLNSNDNVLIIEGNPGVGKSSFLYYLAFKYYQKTNYYFIRLADLNFDSSKPTIIKAFSEYISDDVKWGKLKDEESSAVLFMDGFDEIKPRISMDDFEQLLNQLFQKKVKIVITTRPGYLYKDNSNALLTLKGYDQNQINKWVSTFLKLKNRTSEIDSILQQINNKVAKNDNFDEVLGIPISILTSIAE